MDKKADTVKCRCGFDSGVTQAKGSFNIGEEMRRTGMIFIFLEDGESVWICPECARKAQEYAEKITKIIGSDYWRASSVLRAK